MHEHMRTKRHARMHGPLFHSPRGHYSLCCQWADRHRTEGRGEGRYDSGGGSGCCYFFFFFFLVGCVGRGRKKGVGLEESLMNGHLPWSSIFAKNWFMQALLVSWQLHSLLQARTERRGEEDACVSVCPNEQWPSMWPQLWETPTIRFQKTSRDAILFMLAHTRECTAGVAMTWITNELMGA